MYLINKDNASETTFMIGSYGVPMNNSDLIHAITWQIETYCADCHLSFLGIIPYDLTMVEALVRRMPVVEYTQNRIGGSIRAIWQRIIQQLATGGVA